jgi:hypothetical protein
VSSVQPPSRKETTVPLHRSTLRRAAAVATTCIAAATATVAVAADQPALNTGPGAAYFDLEANKATSMRALGEHRTDQIPRYQDLEANKAGRGIPAR